MKYKVHIFAVVRVGITDIEAESQEEAIDKAEEMLEPYSMFQDLGGMDTEYAEENAYYLVDEEGDEQYLNSKWHSGAMIIDNDGQL